MHKVGENETDNDYSDEDDDDDDSEQKDDKKPIYQSNHRPNNGLIINRNHQNNMQTEPYSNNNWNNQANYGANNDHRMYNNQPNYNSNLSKNGTAKNQTEQDRACLVHCFFHELKMVFKTRTS